MADARGWRARLGAHLPRRETIHHNPLLRPFAAHLAQSNLWRFNKRSVPRAVAVGLGIGIVVPFMHMALAALLAIPTRANIMVAAAVTLLVNPLTIPPLYYAAYQIGRWELHQGPIADVNNAAHVTGELSRLMFWLHHASGPIALGTITIAVAASVLGYVGSSIGWRLWIASRLRHRRIQRQLARRSTKP